LIKNTFDRKHIYANPSSYPNPTTLDRKHIWSKTYLR